MFLDSRMLIMSIGGRRMSFASLTRAKRNTIICSFPFECETLKVDKQSEEHIHRHEVVVNIGTMKIRGLNFDSDDHEISNTSTLKSNDMDVEPFIIGNYSRKQYKVWTISFSY